FGATTGRPRRCGWLDLVALKYAVMMNGVSELIMMKADVLNCFKTVKVCTAYEIGGKQVSYFPFESGEQVTPVYKEFPGWDCDICGVREYQDFPQAFKDYVAFIEQESGCPVKIISVGPDRKEIVLR
ncbi:MAG: adenylosuccinate synthetase, partial [Synergistaceae bacterium]|nr:adenylosuccinate synthetase [Synergistaceae bacterium]